MKIKYEVSKISALLLIILCGSISAGTINYFEFNEGVIGTNLDNTDATHTLITDTAPLGSPQFHDNFDDGDSNGPGWVSTGAIGDGVGLEFSRADGAGDRTRISQWLNLSQGDYIEGGSFTIMARVKASEAVDGRKYTIFGLEGYETLTLEGTSTGQLLVKGLVRDGTANAGSEIRWNASSGDNSNNELFFIDTDTWYNVFLIYNANTSLTVAADDGVNFVSNTNSTVPAGFDSLTHLFADSARHWIIGSSVTTSGEFEGIIELIRVYDEAISLAKADAVGTEAVMDCNDVHQLGFALKGDYNADCKIDFSDFAEMAANWALCNNPVDSNCISNW